MKIITLFWLLIAVLSGCSDSGGSGGASPGTIDNPFPLGSELVCRSLSIVPTIDGLIEGGEWADATAYVAEIPWRDQADQLTAGTTNVLILAKNDWYNIYLAFRYDDALWDDEVDVNNNPTLLDLFTLGFDEDLSGSIDSGEDQKDLVAIWSGGFFDKYSASDNDSRFDGFGRMRYHSGEARFHVELCIPLDSGDANDLSMGRNESVGLFVRIIDAFDGAVPANTRGQAYLFDGLSGHVGTLRTAVTLVYFPPSLPAFTGDLALISRREFAKGDIFHYDFGLEFLTRVTNGNTTPAHEFYKDGVSISNDGQWVAFHGAPNETDYGNYEIYKIRTDGTQLTQLTSTPGVLVGHPAWSPDDTEIVYAQFTSGTASDLMVMDSGTGVLKRRLTDNVHEDNDPDWSPDGTKIVFKSKRWTGIEQLGVMDADGDSATWPDGKNVLRLTTNSYSDHDGVYTADGQWVLFERYIGPGLWTDSVQLLWPPKDPKWCDTNWEVWGVRPDGSQERLLSEAHPTINAEWLPVGERSFEKGYVFIRTWGMEYSVLHRVPADGGEPVPLLPELTNVTYFDWK